MNTRDPNRGANGKGGSCWIWKPTRLAIYHRDGDKCVWCGATEALSIATFVAPAGRAAREASPMTTLFGPRAGELRFLELDDLELDALSPPNPAAFEDPFYA